MRGAMVLGSRPMDEATVAISFVCQTHEGRMFEREYLESRRALEGSARGRADCCKTAAPSTLERQQIPRTEYMKSDRLRTSLMSFQARIANRLVLLSNENHQPGGVFLEEDKNSDKGEGR